MIPLKLSLLLMRTYRNLIKIKMGTITKTKSRKQALLDTVIELIKRDVACGETEALDELLNFLPDEILLHYLPESEWKPFLGKAVYQPDFDNPKVRESNLFSFQVYRSRKNAQRDFPGVEILEYNIEDIEDPTFID